MKKNGFTLIELLAVVAILAILTIIALPNVIKYYNESKKNIFVVEVQSMIKESELMYLRYHMNSEELSIISSESDIKFSSDNDDKFDYAFLLDTAGHVTNFTVSDGTHCIDMEYDGSPIDSDNVYPCDSSEIVEIPSFQQAYVAFGGYYWKVLANGYDMDKFNEELNDLVSSRNSQCYSSSDGVCSGQSNLENSLILMYDGNPLSNEPNLSFGDVKYEGSSVDQWLNTTFYNSLGSSKKYLKDVYMTTEYERNSCQGACASYQNKVGLLSTIMFAADYGFDVFAQDNSNSFDFTRMWISASGNKSVNNYMLSSSSTEPDNCHYEEDPETGVSNEICEDTVHRMYFIDKIGYVENTYDEISTHDAHLRPIISIDTTKIKAVQQIGTAGYTDEEIYEIIEREVHSILETIVHANMSDEEIEALGGMYNAKLYILEQEGLTVSDIEQLAYRAVSSGVFSKKPVYQLFMG